MTTLQERPVQTEPEKPIPADLDSRGFGGNHKDGYVRPENYLGRSVRVVGPIMPPNPADDPHARNRRGELGQPLYNWYFNTISKDPLSRMGFGTHNADPKSLLVNAISRAPRGAVNPDKVEVTDPAVMTKHIKRVLKFLGADAVGIARTDPAYMYSGGARRGEDDQLVAGGAGDTPDTLAERFPYAICYLVAWDDKMVRAHRHRIGDTTYYFSGQKQNVIQNAVSAHVRELGYTVRNGVANAMPMALLSGLGEIGRNGLVISEKHGARVHPAVLLTDLPLVPDKPIDIGVSDFCAVCKKCAVSCPTNSISHDAKGVINGVEKYKINWRTCYGIRAFWSHAWQLCLTCVASCPYTKPNAWYHRLAVQTLKHTPVPLRKGVIYPLKWIDDQFWGKLPRKRVQWLGYDSGRPPEDADCNIAGCSCHDENPITAKAGVYMPLKENAVRFQAKSRAAKAKEAKVGK